MKWLVLVNQYHWYFENFREAATFANNAEQDHSVVAIYKLVYTDGKVLKE